MPSKKKRRQKEKDSSGIDLSHISASAARQLILSLKNVLIQRGHVYTDELPCEELPATGQASVRSVSPVSELPPVEASLTTEAHKTSPVTDKTEFLHFEAGRSENPFSILEADKLLGASSYADPANMAYEAQGAKPKRRAEFFDFPRREDPDVPSDAWLANLKRESAINDYCDQIAVMESRLNAAKEFAAQVKSDRRGSIAILPALSSTHKPLEVGGDLVSSDMTPMLTKSVTAPPAGQRNLMQSEIQKNVEDLHESFAKVSDMEQHLEDLQESFAKMSVAQSRVEAELPYVPQVQARSSGVDNTSVQIPISGSQQVPPISSVSQRFSAQAASAPQQFQPLRLQPQQLWGSFQQQPSAPVQQQQPVFQPPQPSAPAQQPVLYPQQPVFMQATAVTPLTGESKLKHSGHNYKAWVTEIKVILRREGTLCMIINPPAQPWTPEISALDTKACTTMLMSIDTELQAIFPPDVTAQQLWNYLDTCYRPISIESTCLLLSEFHGSKLKPGQPIAEHLTNMVRMRRELGERGYNIDDYQMISVIISSLNYEWKDAISKINHVPVAQRTVGSVCKLLTEEEAVMLATPHLRVPPASRVPARRNFQGRAYVPRTPRCYICNRQGHATRDCPHRFPVPDQSRGEGPRGARGGRGRGDRPARRGSRGDSHPPMATLSLFNNPQQPDDLDTRLMWTLDSGAAIHATHRRDVFTELHQSDLKELYSFSKHVCKVEGKGTVYIPELDALIPDVYYIPKASSNLLSQSHLTKALGYEVLHLRQGSFVMRDGAVVAETILVGGVYYLKPKTQAQASIQNARKKSTGPERVTPERDPVATPKIKALKANEKEQVAQSKPEVPHKIVNVKHSLTGKHLHYRCIHKWHRRLGHPSFDVLKKMPEFVKGLDLKGCKVFLDCAVCSKSKSKAAAIPKRATRLSTRIFDLVHTDIVGPFRPTLGGNRYYLTIVDSYSRYGYVYLMKEKSETFQIFKDFAALVYNQHGVRIRRIQSDRGGEFMSQRIQAWMRRNGIHHQTSAPYTPAHNGVAERRQGVLQTRVRCLLEDANLNNQYWGEALKYANHLVNRTWSSVINQTPFFMMYGYKPDIRNLHIFGSYAMVNIPLAQRRKGGPAAVRMRFMGFDDNSKYTKFADSRNILTVSQSATFEEDADWSRIHSNDPGVYFPRDDVAGAAQPDDQDFQASVPDTSSSKRHVPSSRVADADASDGDEDEGEWSTTPRRSKRTTKGVPPQRYSSQVTKTSSSLICNNVTVAPENFSQIKHLPELEQEKWYEAMKIELNSLKKLKVFTPAKPPTNKKVIGTRWVYRIKQKPTGESLYKARLVAQGFAQRYPDDYTDTYSPTVRTESVKIALTTATILGLEVFQFDVETAYLNADLDEEIYVRGPPGFQKQEGDTWFLHKSLYGLKQSGLMWYLCLIDKLNLMGFIKSDTDECVFTKRSNNVLEKVLVYVDDIVYIGPNKQMSNDFAKALQRHFTLKSLGHIHTYLGVKFDKTQKGFSLTQEDKIDQLLHHCNMTDANTGHIPMQTDFYNLAHESSPEFEDQTFYRSVIGSLLYISSWSRPDIALSVNLLSRHVGKATEFHWSCIKKLLRYLKHTKGMKLLLEPIHTDYPELCCYADSDWASDKKSRKSTSGYIVFLNGCPVYWQVRKQNFISCSSTEAEYACVSDACNSLTWFDALVGDIWTKPTRPITVMEDNSSVVHISESHFTGSRSRHIDIRYKNIKQLVKQGFVKLQYVSTKEQIADMLNKPLPANQHEYLREKMCLM